MLRMGARMFGPGDEADYIEIATERGVDVDETLQKLGKAGAVFIHQASKLKKAPKQVEKETRAALLMKTKAELRMQLPDGGANVRGSGSDGSVLKEDLVNAVLAGSE
jgi:hypothetical protein